MQRFLLSLAAVPLFLASASAQCFEQNFGTLCPLAGGTAGIGDDVMFDVQPMNINFPMAGLSTSYTHASVCSNGVIYLNNGGGTSGSTYAYQDIFYFLGDVGADPRIAAFWIDLESSATYGGGVYFNNTIPGKFVVTWSNIVEWAATQNPGGATPFTVQAQLFDNGDVRFYYDSGVYGISSGFGPHFVSRVGISEGNGVADPGGVDLSVGGNINVASFAMYEEWPLNVFDLNNLAVEFTYLGTGYFQNVGPCDPAFHQVYGKGCYDISTAHYTMYDDAALASAALQGQSITWTPAGAQYLVDVGGPAYVVPVGAVSLTIGDDAEVEVVLSQPFPTAAGPVASLWVSSNGVVSVAQNSPALWVGSTSYYPQPEDLLQATEMGWWAHHDYNPTEAGSGPITYFEQVVSGQTIAYFTWEGVENYPTGTPNVSTIQFQFNLTLGDVAIVFDSVDTDTSSPFGSQHQIGWAPGGGSVDAGSIDLFASVPFVPAASNVSRMTLGASPAPISTPLVGTTVTYTTDNMPEFAPGIYVGMTIFSASQLNPGIDLGLIGAPGCNAYVGTFDLTLAMVGLTPSNSVDLVLPLGVPAGIEVFVQSIALFPPGSMPNGQNSFGMAVSNGVLSYISSF